MRTLTLNSKGSAIFSFSTYSNQSHYITLFIICFIQAFFGQVSTLSRYLPFFSFSLSFLITLFSFECFPFERPHRNPQPHPFFNEKRNFTNHTPRADMCKKLLKRANILDEIIDIEESTKSAFRREKKARAKSLC